MQNSQEIKFNRAIRHNVRARLAIDGPSGAGKTYTSLIAAHALANGDAIAVIDTERGSASLYSDIFQFDVLELDSFDPRLYTQAISVAEKAGYGVIVIDSLSHAWEGEGGALDQLNKIAKRSYSGSTFAAWKDINPLQWSLVDAMLSSSAHIIATMRSRMEYVQDKNEKTGRTEIRKVGMAPVQRQGIEYEFHVVADMDIEHNLVIAKTRCKLLDGAVVNSPTADFFMPYAEWLKSSSKDPLPLPKISSPVQDAKTSISPLKTQQKNSSLEKLNSKRSWSVDQVQSLLTAGLAENSHNAVSILNLSSLPSDAAPSLCSRWALSYRDIRNINHCEPERAAEVVNELYKLNVLPDSQEDKVGQIISSSASRKIPKNNA